MGIKPLHIRDIEEQTDDMYEAVAVMAARSRQILRDRIVDQAMRETDQDSFGVFDTVPEIDPADYVELPKPTAIASDEFLNGEISWHKSKVE
ncbi:MAG: DNA-directed RNA polymerase subunit omega [Candidatus Marinimicrobia bacterium]|nr:DNA-directed RNA polymerase subunit omega [Candidatus Neomarinimicrobiota bacterium]